MNATLSFLNGYNIQGAAQMVYDLLSIFESSRCDRFIQMNQIYFQIANVFFLLSYFASNSKYGIIYLRFMSLLGCAFIAIWGLKILCSFDIFVWNVTFIALCMIHILVLITRLWPTRFSKEIEAVMKHKYRKNQLHYVRGFNERNFCCSYTSTFSNR